jgi:hypothetical protein
MIIIPTFGCGKFIALAIGVIIVVDDKFGEGVANYRYAIFVIIGIVTFESADETRFHSIGIGLFV